MTQYLLSIYQPDGPPPDPEALRRVMTDITAFMEDLKRTGAWVFNAGLHPPGTATVVRVQAGEILTTDGPFAEGKEHVGGFIVMNAADLDDALARAQQLARMLTLPGRERGLAVEVRPLQGERPHAR